MGISIWQLLIVLGIVILLFGTKKLRNIGGDLGGAIRGFKKSMNEDDPKNGDDKQDKEAGTIEDSEKATAQSSQADQKSRDKTPS